MTKHLRLLMLALLALVCMGGYSQEVTFDFTDYKGNPWKLPTSGYSKEEATFTNGDYSIKLTPGIKKGFMLLRTKGSVGTIQMGNQNAALALPIFNFDVEKIVVVGNAAVGNKSVTQNIFVDNVSVSTETKGSASTNQYLISEKYQKSGNIYVLKVTNSYLTHINKIQIYKKQDSGKTATTTTFGAGYDGKTFTFTDGVLEGFTAPTATWTPTEVGGSVAYSSSDKDVVTVDNEGKLNFTNTKFGTATITATFTPKETTKYKISSASYTVVNKEGERIATTIAFAKGIENATVTVKDGETFEGYKATCTPEGAKGAIQYSSSNTDVATVDESTGAVTLGNKYGKTVITAQFIGTDGYANSDKISYTIEYKGDYAFYESFDKCDGNGGNDGAFNKAGNLLSDDSFYDNSGWKSGTAYKAKQCIKLGGGSTLGTITSPIIQISKNSLLTFNAVAWNNTSEKLTVEVSVDDGLLTYNNTSDKTITITLDKTKWKEYQMVVSGTNSFKVTFAAAESKNNRFFLDEVMVKELPVTDVTLNEDEANIVEASNNANVTLKRTLYDGGWNTLCLPFSLTDAQTKAAFGSDVELRTLASFDGNTLTFVEAMGITAGVPCLIKVNKVPDNNTYTFTGVSVKAIKTDTDKYDMDESLTFVGIYAPMDVATAFEKDGKAHFLGTGNKFYKAKAGTTMKAFRAFFLVPASTDTQALKAVIDGTTTGIDDLNLGIVKADGRVYNLNGQCVGYSLEGLKAGIYIQNGKKVIKK